jgi:metallo-beta-lactamase family protein
MTVNIKFCGAAGTVTGSCYWIRTDDCQFLVDCGLFQGTKTLKELNYGTFPFDANALDFVLLTHAHTDHSAMVPKLIKAGFKGHVIATHSTKELLQYMLPDSGYIQEVEVSRLNRRNQQRGKSPVTPIYTRQDAEASISQIKGVEYEEWLDLMPTVRARFWNAGHILGSASIEIEVTDEGKTQRLLFSGDIGPDHKLFHADPDAPTNFDYVICESTYGGRNRKDVSVPERRQILSSEINQAMEAGGSLVIPSFAVERTQELLLDIAWLLQKSEIPGSLVFLDSPLAIRITSVFAKYMDALEDIGDNMQPFNHSSFHFTETVDESKSIARFTAGVIILAASGMCDAGRIRHHLKNHLWRPQSTILLVGYQAEGTLGQMLEKGLKNVNIMGEAVKVRARIRKIDTYSGHADGNNLIEWIQARQPIKGGVFLTHGNKEALFAMQSELQKIGFENSSIMVPMLDEEYELTTTGKAVKISDVSKRLDPDRLDKPDWHNDLAQLTLDIRAELEQTSSNKQRANVLNKLRQALSGKTEEKSRDRK